MDQTLLPTIPVIARLDGRAFHTFCTGLRRPFDERFSNLMIDTTSFLVSETGALCGYTQSDEISLVWVAGSLKEQIFFDGRLLKMVSVLASMTSAYFTKHLEVFLPEKQDMLAMFDCRVWNVPLDYEAANYFIWREGDATRNSVSMAAQSKFSHKALHGKGRSEMHEMLFQKGINWNDYPQHFKRGTYVRKRIVERPFTTDEVDSLPEKHAARNNPDLKIRRTVVMVEEDFPPLTQIVNRTEVILEGADPETASNQK